MAAPLHKREGDARAQEPLNAPQFPGDSPDTLSIRRPVRVKLSREETRARMETFTAEREEAFVAAVREDED